MTDAAFDPARFDRLVGPGWAPVLHAEVTASTQTLLREAFDRQPAVDGRWRAAVADVQTAGRGRRDARWLASPRAALLLTLGGPLGLDQALWPRASLIAGLAAAELLEERFGVVAQLKWPNDLLVLDDAAGRWKKIAGLLCERIEPPAGPAVWLCGVGINLRPSPTWPDDLSARSASIADWGSEVDRTEFAALLAVRIRETVETWRLSRGELPIRRLEARLAFRHCDVQVDLGGDAARWVRLEGLDAAGALRVRSIGTAVGAPEILLPLALLAAKSEPPWHAPAPAADPVAARSDP